MSRLPAFVERRIEARVRERVRARLAARRLEDARFLFVVAPGRSGSTLVQGLLNELPGTVVRGENGLYLLDLFRVMRSTITYRTAHRSHRPKQVVSAFYGLHHLRRPAFAQMAREFFVRTALGGDFTPDQVKVLGFKEVLWHRVEPEETEEFFDFLDSTFGDVRYVLNLRERESIMGSGFWKRADPEAAVRALDRTGEVQEYLRASRPDRVLDLHYEELTSSDDERRDATLRTLAEFALGEPATPEVIAKLAAAMQTGYGPNPFGASRS